jgi:CheY-like chemotaxis protein/two-component sensor histidine kinase
MSHEIRTPMNAILGMISLSRRRVQDERVQDQLDKAFTAAEHLLAILNAILDISKIEADRMTLEHRPFSLMKVVSSSFNLTRQRAIDKGLVFKVDLPPELDTASFEGDSVRLGQVITNLVSNAIKFTEQGSISLTIRRQNNDVLHFEVKDTGIGIPADALGRLFRPFEQADGSTTRRFGGTGLGLVISKRLVEMMGGEIGVESHPGQGSTFWFSIRAPEIPALVVPSAPSITAPSAEAQLRQSFSGTRVLLAEDDIINQEVARMLLEDAGLAVELAMDGNEAVSMARAHPYALILMDMQMPNLNGVDATRIIRTMPHHAATPILAMTANAFEQDRQLCLDAGMNDHLSKPVAPDHFYTTLLTWLQKP